MTHRSFLGVIAAALLPCPLAAQTKIDSATYPIRPTYQHQVLINATYDSQYDKTVLRTEPFHLTPTLSVSILTALQGQTVTKPAASVVFTLWLTAPSDRNGSDHRVRVVLNQSDTLNLGNAWISPTHPAEYSEVLLKSMSLGQFLAITNASSVALVLGDNVLPLTQAQLEGLRDFASRMTPSQQ